MLAQRRAQLLRQIIVETQERGSQLFFKYAGLCEQPKGSALNPVRRYQQNLALSLEKRTRNSSVHRLGKSDQAVIESDVNVLSLNGGVAYPIHLFGIQVHVPKL